MSPEVQSKESFSSKVSLNMATNVVRTVLMVLAGLLMVPYYIDQFGLAAYAILPLATSITNYFLIIADSLSNAFSRYMSIAVQNGDREQADKVFSSSVSSMAKCVLAMLPFAVVISLAAPYIFDAGESSAGSVQLMFLMILLAALIISFSASFGGVYMARNRVYVTYAARALQTLSQVGVVVLLLAMRGPDLVFIGESYLAAAVVVLAIMVAFARVVDPELRYRRGDGDRGLRREMNRLGLWAVLAELGSMLFIQASLVVVNVMMGAEAQGEFSIAANVVMTINTALSALAAVSLPLAYREFAVGNMDGLLKVLKLFAKFMGLTMAFPLAYLMVYADEIMGVWLGTSYGSLVQMLYLMLPVMVALSSVNVLSETAVVFNRAQPLAVGTIACGVLNVVLAVLVLSFTDWGMIGVCVCWAVSMLILKLVFYPVFSSRVTKAPLWSYYRPVVESYVVFAVCLVLMYGLSLFFTPSGWVTVLVPFAVLFVAYFVLEVRFMLNEEERRLAMTYLPGFVQRIVRRPSA